MGHLMSSLLFVCVIFSIRRHESDYHNVLWLAVRVSSSAFVLPSKEVRVESGASPGWQHPHLLDLRCRLLTFSVCLSPNTHAQRTARRLTGGAGQRGPAAHVCITHVSSAH